MKYTIKRDLLSNPRNACEQRDTVVKGCVDHGISGDLVQSAITINLEQKLSSE
jgi:hypothetical protein